MSLYPFKAIFQRTLLAVRKLANGDPRVLRFVNNLERFPDVWDNVPPEVRRDNYAMVLGVVGPIARNVYMAGGSTAHHSLANLWVGTVQHFRALYSREENPSLNPPPHEVLDLVRSWDPCQHGQALNEKELTALRNVAGVVHAMKHAGRELPSIGALLSHPALTARKARCYGYQAGGVRY
ncbi:hypothetical protein JCM6882_004575 [Rhodosporidiobolus microsporus]